MLAEAGEASRLQEAQIFRLFYRTSFFYRNPPPHLRGRVRASFCRERRLMSENEDPVDPFPNLGILES